jgi:hypothetical protein
MQPEAPEVMTRRRSVGSPFHPVNPQQSPNLRPFSPNVRPAQPPLAANLNVPPPNHFLQYGNGPVRVPPQAAVPFMPELQLPSLPVLDELGLYHPVPTAAPQLLQ